MALLGPCRDEPSLPKGAGDGEQVIVQVASATGQPYISGEADTKVYAQLYRRREEASSG